RGDGGHATPGRAGPGRVHPGGGLGSPAPPFSVGRPQEGIRGPRATARRRACAAAAAGRPTVRRPLRHALFRAWAGTRRLPVPEPGTQWPGANRPDLLALSYTPLPA